MPKLNNETPQNLNELLNKYRYKEYTHEIMYNMKSDILYLISKLESEDYFQFLTNNGDMIIFKNYDNLYSFVLSILPYKYEFLFGKNVYIIFKDDDKHAKDMKIQYQNQPDNTNNQFNNNMAIGFKYYKNTKYKE